MTNKPKLTIFKNDKVGQPIKKKDGSIVEYNGEPMLHCDLNGKINLPEGLPAGDYEVSIYKNTAKSGLSYYSGTIKVAWKKSEQSKQPQMSQQDSQAFEELDDIIPF